MSNLFGEGKLRSWGIGIACFVILLSISIFYASAQFRGFNSMSAMDNAQVAREIVRGHGMKTKFIQPLVITELEKQSIDKKVDVLSMPDTQNPPLYPYFLATLFKVTGTKFKSTPEEIAQVSFRYKPENVVMVMNVFMTLVVVGLVYGWARRMFDGRVAFLSAALVALCDNIWNTSVSGGSWPLLMLLVVGMGWCITESLIARDEEKNMASVIWYIAAVILAGLAGLTSYHFIWIALAVVVLGFIVMPFRAVAGISALLILAILWVPWFIRNIYIVGHPLGTSWTYMFHGYAGLSGDSIWRLSDVASNDVGLRRFIRIITYGSALQTEYSLLLTGSIVVAAFYISSIMHAFRSSRIQIERWFGLACFIVLFFANAITFRQYDLSSWVYLNSLVVLMPMLSIFASAFFYVLLDRLAFPYTILRHLSVIAFCAASSVPFLWTLTSNSKPIVEFPPYFPQRLALLQSIVDEKDFICSDIPWANAWYTDRTTLWLPVHIKDFHQISDYKQHITGILFTPKSRDGKMFATLEKGEYKEWLPVITRQNNMPILYANFLLLMPEGEYFYLSDRSVNK